MSPQYLRGQAGAITFAGMDISVGTRHYVLHDNESKIVRSMAALVMQGITFGERAGKKVCRSGLGFARGRDESRAIHRVDGSGHGRPVCLLEEV
jgi:hypothetical protein